MKKTVLILVAVFMVFLGFNHPYLASENGTYVFNVDVKTEGDYYLKVNYKSSLDIIDQDYVHLTINGQDIESNYTLDKQYAYSGDGFETDRYGNEIISSQEILTNETSTILKQKENKVYAPVTFHLNAGTNEVKVTTNTDVQILSVEAKQNLLTENTSTEKGEGQSYYEAENFQSKNNIKINAKSLVDAHATPLAPSSNKINVIDGATFNEAGNYIEYNVEVPKSGLYDIYLNGQVQGVKNLGLYLNIYVNDNLVLQNEKVADTNGLEITKLENSVYLNEGTNTIGFEITNENLAEVLTSLKTMEEEIIDLESSILQITGGVTDENRDWGITTFLPDLETQLTTWNETTTTINEQLLEVSGQETELNNMLELINGNFEKLLEDPDNIPNHMGLLSDGTTSALYLIQEIEQEMVAQGYTFDGFYVVGQGQELEVNEVHFYDDIKFSFENFISSFTLEEVESENEKEIDVWVYKPRQYVDVMQKMADQIFTPQTGIKVNFSVLTDQSKITMANAAGTTPDLAISIDSWYAYELGLRDALVDLNEYPETKEMISNVAPGGLLPVIVGDSLYGMSETQDVYVMYYRTDIFDTYGLEVPNTWSDVTSLLSELQSYGMNFYIPMSGGTSLKSFPSTGPFFMQNEVPIYSEDGTQTNLYTPEGQESLQTMIDFYSLYGMEINVPNFYNDFVDGEIPVGISNFSTYIQLTFASDEMQDQWAIAPVPGTVNENGEVIRWMPGATTMDVVFENSENKEEAMQYLTWWTSEETQEEFNQRLISLYGGEYIWNSANINAFLSLPLPEEDLAVYEEMIGWVQEVPRIPGAYIVERGISDIWNNVIFNGENLKVATAEQVDSINKELEVKMIEFGYRDENGELIKPYEVPTIDKVNSWIEEDENEEND